MSSCLRHALLALCLFSFGSAAQQSPNIILVVLDDLGWRDVGYMGNPFIETPTLDRLASEGLVFTNAYANSPNCAPSRAAIMSGLYAPRTDVYTMFTGDMGEDNLRRVLTPPNKMYLKPSVVTLAETLQAAGYHTAHIGKWNLGTGKKRGPEGQGFDVNIGGHRGGHPQNGYFAPYNLPGLEQAPKGEYLTDRLSQEAVNFIEQHHNERFFIYLSHFAPHFPYQAPADLLEKYQQKKQDAETRGHIFAEEFAAMVESVDRGLADILSTLRKHQLDNNTLIVVTSDNGGATYISYLPPLRGQKSLLYEGGIRVPMLFWWPGTIEAQQSAVPTIGIDLYPTLATSAKATPPPHLDGTDLSPLFDNTEAQLPRQNLFWYFPAYIAGMTEDANDRVFQQRPAAVIRQGDWKLIQYLDSDAVELYNLVNDVGERNNVAEQNLQIRNALQTSLNQWLAEMEAPLPLEPNPSYSASAEEKIANSWWRKMRLRFNKYFPQSNL